jgi:hypothetical protein
MHTWLFTSGKKGKDIVITQSMLCEDTWDKSIMPKRPIILVTNIENGKETKRKDCPRKGKSAF